MVGMKTTETHEETLKRIKAELALMTENSEKHYTRLYLKAVLSGNTRKAEKWLNRLYSL